MASCCAATTLIPSSKVPTTTTLLNIGQLSMLLREFQNAAKNRRGQPCRRPRPSSLTPGRPVHSAAGSKSSEPMPPFMFADRHPPPLRRCRHVDVVDLVFAPQAVDDGVDDCRTRADRAGFASTLHAQ